MYVYVSGPMNGITYICTPRYGTQLLDAFTSK